MNEIPDVPASNSQSPVDSPGLVGFSVACSNGDEASPPLVLFYTKKNRVAKHNPDLDLTLSRDVCQNKSCISKTPKWDPEGGSDLAGRCGSHLPL